MPAQSELLKWGRLGILLFLPIVAVANSSFFDYSQRLLAPQALIQENPHNLNPRQDKKPEITPFLIRSLSDPNREVRYTAAQVIEERGWPLQEKDWVRYYIAVEYWNDLVGLGSSAVPSLIRSLSLFEPDWEIQTRLTWALGTIRDKRAVRPLARILRESEDWLIRYQAAWALGEIGSRRASKVLHEVLQDRDLGVREASADAFRKIWPEFQGLDTDFIQEILRANPSWIGAPPSQRRLQTEFASLFLPTPKRHPIQRDQTPPRFSKVSGIPPVQIIAQKKPEVSPEGPRPRFNNFNLRFSTSFVNETSLWNESQWRRLYGILVKMEKRLESDYDLSLLGKPLKMVKLQIKGRWTPIYSLTLGKGRVYYAHDLSSGTIILGALELKGHIKGKDDFYVNLPNEFVHILDPLSPRVDRVEKKLFRETTSPLAPECSL